MDDKMRAQLKEMIQAQIKTSFVPEYQAKATDQDALGLILAHYFEWDGLAILETMYRALEDANFHTENKNVEAMIERVKKQYGEAA